MRRRVVLCGLTMGLGLAGSAAATTLIPMSIGELAQSSQVVVAATVEATQARQEADGHIRTAVQIAVEEILSGSLEERSLTLIEDGGTVGDEIEVIDGAPTFDVGEHVIVFLIQRADGRWRTNQLFLGKFRIEAAGLGNPRATQAVPAGTIVVLPPGVASLQPSLPLDAVLDAIRKPEVDTSADTVLPSLNADDTHEVEAAFTLATIAGQPARFYEPDEGLPLTFLIDQRGDSKLGFTASRRAVDAAFAAWTGVTTAALDLRDGGLTTELSPACPGPNPLIVRFEDPLSEIPPPFNCHGMLAVGGFRARASESKFFNGKSFAHSLCATLTFADGWNACAVWDECNLGEIATHELGHSIGLAHSSDRNPEPDAYLSDATMYFMAHFDDRCAGVRGDDEDGVSFIYPLAMPPTITTPDVLPPGIEGQPYVLQLSASGGTGTFTWTLTRQTNVTGFSVGAADGVLSGNPMTTGGGNKSLIIRATDANGDSHAKLFTIALLTPPPTTTPRDTATSTPTPPSTMTPTTTETPTETETASPTETPRPTPTPTAPPSVTPVACGGDCDHSGGVTVDELVTLVNIDLGTAGIQTCPAGDLDHSGDITVDEIVVAVNIALSMCPL